MNRGGRLRAVANKRRGGRRTNTMARGGAVRGNATSQGRRMARNGAVGFGSCKDQTSETTCKDMGCRWNYHWSSCN